MLCLCQGAVLEGCLQGRSLQAAQVCGDGLQGLLCLLQDGNNWGPSKGRKMAGPCRSAACVRATDDSRAAAESVGEGMSNRQPPSRRGRPSCNSAVCVAKGPAMSAPACWITRAASLTETSMVPAAGSSGPVRIRYVSRGTMESRSSRCLCCSSRGTSMSISTLLMTASAVLLPKACTKPGEPKSLPPQCLRSHGADSAFAQVQLRRLLWGSKWRAWRDKRGGRAGWCESPMPGIEPPPCWAGPAG
jgi:hypothetical protein